MKKAKRKSSKTIKFLFICLFLTIFLTLYSFSNSMLIDIGTEDFQGVLSTASYYAINESLTEEYNYDNLFTIHKNDEKEIVMISTNSYKFNKLSTVISNSVNNYLYEYTKDGVDVPIGVFTGISLFSGFGPKVKMPLISITSVKCNIVSKFSDAGINQTKHSIYIEINSTVSIITRFSVKKLNEYVCVLFYENLLIGKVPEIYLKDTVYSN